MKIQLSKKVLITVLIVFSILFVVVLVLFIKAQIGKNYPEEPVPIESLGTTTQTVDLSDINKENKYEDVPLFKVEKKTHIALVEDFILETKLSLKKTEIEKDIYVEWKDENNIVTYNSITGIFEFKLNEGLSIERSTESFKEIFSKYFEKEYEFVVNREQRNNYGGVTYYASRVLDEIPVEKGFSYEYSDMLIFDEKGELIAGRLLLGEVTKLEILIPLIKDSVLNQYVNSPKYPKEVYIDTSVLQDTLQLSYLSDEWEDIEKSASDCKGSEKTVIYLLKGTDQEYLLPVYKLDATCSVIYKENSYSVPATFYINAVDPDYITTE